MKSVKGELSELLREQRVHVAALRATSERMKQAVGSNEIVVRPAMRRLLLLQMAEAIIQVHRAAKIDGDGLTLDYVEDAMRHVAERLAKEHGDDRNFRTRRFGTK